MSQCSLCLSLGVLKKDPKAVTTDDLFVSGFVMGVVMQRVAEKTSIGLTTVICKDHLKRVRELANLAAKEHPTLIPYLGFGLSVVEGGKGG